jgi:hypothetical protein
MLSHPFRRICVLMQASLLMTQDRLPRSERVSQCRSVYQRLSEADLLFAQRRLQRVRLLRDGAWLLLLSYPFVLLH